MNKSGKLSPQNTADKIYPQNCPVCGVTTNYIYRIEDRGTDGISTWYRCNCGILFQDKLPAHDCYNTDYITKRTVPEYTKRVCTSAYTYSPIIESLTYGRKMLDVGFTIVNTMEYMEKRGWLTWGIDINKSVKNKNCVNADFITYNFDIDIAKDVLVENTGSTDIIKREFDLIWMNDVLEHFNEPLKGLKKVKDLLSETGIVFISTPDIGFINKTGVPAFPYWKPAEHYVMWSERALKRELERLGFNIVMCRRNYSATYNSFYTIHCIAQKNFF